MKLHCYWKRDSSNLMDIADTIYSICWRVYKKLGYKDWMIYLKKQWSFDISSISKSDFCIAFTDGILQETKNKLKRHRYEVSPNVNVPFGFTISLFLKLPAKEYVSFICSLGIDDANLINTCMITFPKSSFNHLSFSVLIVDVLNPQWATLTEDKLNQGIAEFGKDMIRGYLMYFRDLEKVL